MQLTTADEDLLPMRSNEIGLDSIISVDIRTWLLKEFDVAVPVLKMIGNSTVENLADHVAQNIPASLVPGVGATRQVYRHA
jgi:acyl carrier protein